MSLVKGTVRYLRSLLPDLKRDCPFRGSLTTFGVYQVLLHRANWRDGEHMLTQGIRLKRGQCVVGEAELGERWGISRSAIHRQLVFLEKTGKIERLPGQQGTIVTIVDYDKITGIEAEAGQQGEQKPDRGRTEAGQRPDTSEAVKQWKQKNRKGGSAVSSFGRVLAQDAAATLKEVPSEF